MTRPPRDRPSVVTPGNHDGVHLGHRALVRAARVRADEEGCDALAMFFDPHPTRVLFPERAPARLTTPESRAALLREAGCDDVVVMGFDREFAETSPREFVERVLVDACRARAVVTGPDFHFGKRRSGNIDTLRELGLEYGYDVIVVDPVEYEGAASSSTRVRASLGEGDVVSAAAMLTRLHECEGVVVRGQALARDLGFPTANLRTDEVLWPADGVYAVLVKTADEGRPLVPGVANLGMRPTVDAGRAFEVHLLDFAGDLYDQTLRVGFVARLRGEQKFDGLGSLRAQIAQDCAAARGAIEAFHADGSRKDWTRWLETTR